MATPADSSPGSQEFLELGSPSILPASAPPHSSSGPSDPPGVGGSNTPSGKPPLIASAWVKCLLCTHPGLYAQNKTDSPPCPRGRVLSRTFQGRVGHLGLFLFKKEPCHQKELEFSGSSMALGVKQSWIQIQALPHGLGRVTTLCWAWAASSEHLGHVRERGARLAQRHHLPGHPPYVATEQWECG